MADYLEGSFDSEIAQDAKTIAYTRGVDLAGELFNIRASRGLPIREQNTTSLSEDGVMPEVDLKLFKEMMINDPIISTCVDAFVDVTMMAGYDFYSKREKTKQAKSISQRAWEIFKFDLNFDEVGDNLVRNLLIYGLGYMEPRSTKSGKPKELFMLESTEMAIKYDKHGKLLGFQQRQGNEKIDFKANEVIYFKLKPLGSRVFGLYPLEPVAREYASYTFASSYLQGIFKNMPPRLMYTLKNANSTQRKTFIQNLQIIKQNQKADLVALGEAEGKQILEDLDAGLTDILKYLRQQVYAITRVPPMWTGILEDAGNRGNSEAQIFAFETAVRKVQRVIENGVNRELLPKLGLSNLVFKFNPFSLKDEKAIIENAEKMRAMGVKKEKIAEFLSMRGIYIEAEDIEDQTQQLGKDIISMKRPRMDKKMDNMTNNTNQKGVSELSAQKRPDLEGRSPIEIPKFEDFEEIDQYEEEVLKRAR